MTLKKRTKKKYKTPIIVKRDRNNIPNGLFFFKIIFLNVTCSDTNSQCSKSTKKVLKFIKNYYNHFFEFLESLFFIIK